VAVDRLRPELIVCNSYSMLLRGDVLALPKQGSVNVHGGKLPEFRGPNPLQWALIEDERSAAVTLHWVTEELDAGDVIASRAVEIRLEDGWRDVWRRLDLATDDLLEAELPSVVAGMATRTPQDPTRARRRRRRTPEDGRIDWSRSVLEIYNHIRALGDGLPPAFYELDRERIAIGSPLPIGEVTALAFTPGPGGRALAGDGIQLVPTASREPSFLVTGATAERGGLKLDTDRRIAYVWTSEPDDATTELLRDFARRELGFELG
jgi:methionyl-tRNA formyltransferase